VGLNMRDIYGGGKEGRAGRVGVGRWDRPGREARLAQALLLPDTPS
jgi:hypothetical protein